MADTGFAGFPKEAVKFLSDLKANNTRDWFTANKATYEAAIKGPAAEFCEAMSRKLEKLTGTPCKSKVFRIHRDLRFSKDKTPYNAHLHISFTPETDQASPPCWFFGLEPKRIVLGTGTFGFDKQALEAYRERIDGLDGRKLAKLFEKLAGQGARTGEPDLKRVPSGYAPGPSPCRPSAQKGPERLARHGGHENRKQPGLRGRLRGKVQDATATLRLADCLSADAPRAECLRPSEQLWSTCEQARR